MRAVANGARRKALPHAINASPARRERPAASPQPGAGGCGRVAATTGAPLSPRAPSLDDVAPSSAPSPSAGLVVAVTTRGSSDVGRSAHARLETFLTVKAAWAPLGAVASGRTVSAAAREDDDGGCLKAGLLRPLARHPVGPPGRCAPTPRAINSAPASGDASAASGLSPESRERRSERRSTGAAAATTPLALRDRFGGGDGASSSSSSSSSWTVSGSDASSSAQRLFPYE